MSWARIIYSATSAHRSSWCRPWCRRPGSSILRRRSAVVVDVDHDVVGHDHQFCYVSFRHTLKKEKKSDLNCIFAEIVYLKSLSKEFNQKCYMPSLWFLWKLSLITLLLGVSWYSGHLQPHQTGSRTKLGRSRGTNNHFLCSWIFHFGWNFWIRKINWPTRLDLYTWLKHKHTYVLYVQEDLTHLI